ncbi:MAG: hypothetical protein H7Y32_07300, partial [Chloroflexales bacterium]|nr:hypothetical protein [Chloroflexales bacterium]
MTTFKRELKGGPPDRSLDRVGKTLASTVLGLAGAWSYLTHFGAVDLAALDRALTLAYLALLFGALAYLSLGFVLPRLRAQPMGARAALASTALVGGALLALVLNQATPPPLNTLEIVATGQRAAQSRASQIWLLGLYDSRNVQVPMAELQPEGPWQQQGTALLAESPATLRWSGRIAVPGRIDFISHEWSGVVEVRWNGQAETIDLYAPQHGQRAVALAEQAASVSPLLFLTDAISVAGLLFIIGLLLLLRQPPVIAPS